MKHNFRELKIWKESMELVKDIYALTKTFPKEEQYGLTSQINRAAVSIPTNIAEGAGRNSPKEFNQFLAVALGSAFELETLITISYSISICETIHYENITSKIDEIQKMIVGFKKTLLSDKQLN